MHYTRERVEAMTTGGGYASDWLCADWLELDAALAEARQTIEALRTALQSLIPINCDALHHAKADRHEGDASCPVIARALSLLARPAQEG